MNRKIHSVLALAVTAAAPFLVSCVADDFAPEVATATQGVTRPTWSPGTPSGVLADWCIENSQTTADCEACVNASCEEANPIQYYMPRSPGLGPIGDATGLFNCIESILHEMSADPNANRCRGVQTPVTEPVTVPVLCKLPDHVGNLQFTDQEIIVAGAIVAGGAVVAAGTYILVAGAVNAWNPAGWVAIAAGGATVGAGLVMLYFNEETHQATIAQGPGVLPPLAVCAVTTSEEAPPVL